MIGGNLYVAFHKVHSIVWSESYLIVIVYNIALMCLILTYGTYITPEQYIYINKVTMDVSNEILL